MTSIYGVGVDQVNLERVRKLLSKNKSKFENRCFTQNEIIYSNRFNDPSKRLGARFAAKEAVMKSLGKGWRQLSWKEIEITGGGKPTVILHGKAAEVAKSQNIKDVHISLSHEQEMAIAFAVSEVA